MSPHVRRNAAWWLVGFSSLLLATAAAAQQRSRLTPGTGSISGRVVADDTGKPLRHALVEIVIYGPLSGGPLMSGRFAQIATDDQGKFMFDKLPAGQYQIAAQAPGYIRMQYGQQQPGPATFSNMPRMIELNDGQTVTTADFHLTHFNAIEGIVTDEFGDPAPNVLLQVSQVQFLAGRRRLFPATVDMAAGPIRPTDDRGHFRIGGLPPGTYYVEALCGAFTDPDAAGGFAITYFPGTTESASAQAVTLAPGHDATDVSFTLTPAATQLVTGTVVDGDGQPIANANLRLIPTGTNGPTLFAMALAVAGPDGQFTFRNVPPGSYTIQGYGKPVSNAGNLGAFAFGYVLFRTGSDTSHLVLRVPAPRTLRGHISFEPDATIPMPRPQGVQVSAIVTDFDSGPIGGGPSPFTVHDDWTFEVLALSGLRKVIASAPGWYVKSVTVDGQDVTDASLDFREHDVNGAEIVLTTRTTTVTATLAVPKDHTASDYNVLIFGTDDAKWTPSSRYVVLVRPNQQGTFVARGLPPSQYYVAAVGAVTNGDWQDPEFLKSLVSSGLVTPIALSEGESKTVPLTAIK